MMCLVIGQAISRGEFGSLKGVFNFSTSIYEDNCSKCIKCLKKNVV